MISLQLLFRLHCVLTAAVFAQHAFIFIIFLFLCIRASFVNVLLSLSPRISNLLGTCILKIVNLSSRVLSFRRSETN